MIKNENDHDGLNTYIGSEEKNHFGQREDTANV